MSILLSEYLKILQTGENPVVYIAAMYQAFRVTGMAPNMWVVTGSDLSQRSWCCHSGTPLFYTREECEAYIKLLQATDQRIQEKYGGVRS